MTPGASPGVSLIRAEAARYAIPRGESEREEQSAASIRQSAQEHAENHMFPRTRFVKMADFAVDYETEMPYVLASAPGLESVQVFENIAITCQFSSQLLNKPWISTSGARRQPHGPWSPCSEVGWNGVRLVSSLGWKWGDMGCEWGGMG
jgi:hypothetical protein